MWQVCARNSQEVSAAGAVRKKVRVLGEGLGEVSK